MKYTTRGNCPFCESEMSGYSDGWGMSPEGWEEMRNRHDMGHPENKERTPTEIFNRSFD